MKHIKLFEHFLSENDGYGRDFFFKKKDGKVTNYFFKVEPSDLFLIDERIVREEKNIIKMRR
jgi:hypothetical protein